MAAHLSYEYPEHVQIYFGCWPMHGLCIFRSRQCLQEAQPACHIADLCHSGFLQGKAMYLSGGHPLFDLIAQQTALTLMP